MGGGVGEDRDGPDVDGWAAAVEDLDARRGGRQSRSQPVRQDLTQAQQRPAGRVVVHLGLDQARAGDDGGDLGVVEQQRRNDRPCCQLQDPSGPGALVTV